MPDVVVIKDLSIEASNQTILSNISVAIPKGQIVGLLGPSGSGKTTFIRAILGLHKPTRGSIRIFDYPAGNAQLKRRLGYMSQSPSVYSDLTVKENLNYFGKIVGAKKSEIDTILTEVELDQHQHKVVARLSGGQRARVSLASAMLGAPDVLLLDEPTVGLDPVLRQKMWQKFKQLAQSGTTLFISSHVMDEAQKCDRILFIRDGQLLIADTLSSVLKLTHTRSVEEAFLSLAHGETA